MLATLCASNILLDVKLYEQTIMSVLHTIVPAQGLYIDFVLMNKIDEKC